MSGSWSLLDISLTSTFTNYNFFRFNITVTIDWQQEWFSFFFNSMASYKYGRSMLLGKRVTHWGQKTLPFLLREVILKKWFCKCYRVTVNFISTTVVETLACYHEPSTHLAREDTFGIIIIFDWIVYNKQNLVYCIFLTFFGWKTNNRKLLVERKTLSRNFLLTTNFGGWNKSFELCATGIPWLAKNLFKLRKKVYLEIVV